MITAQVLIIITIGTMATGFMGRTVILTGGMMGCNSRLMDIVGYKTARNFYF